MALDCGKCGRRNVAEKGDTDSHSESTLPLIGLCSNDCRCAQHKRVFVLRIVCLPCYAHRSWRAGIRSTSNQWQRILRTSVGVTLATSIATKSPHPGWLCRHPFSFEASAPHPAPTPLAQQSATPLVNPLAFRCESESL